MSNAWLLRLIALILGALSGPLKAELIKFAKTFREQAQETDNPYDDFAADIICWLLGIP